jgi:hypothetical protein
MPRTDCLRPSSLDHAALFTRHLSPSRRPVAAVENAADDRVSDRAQRRRRSPRTPERRGNSGLRSLGQPPRRFLPPQGQGPRLPPTGQNARNRLTDQSPPARRGPQNGSKLPARDPPAPNPPIRARSAHPADPGDPAAGLRRPLSGLASPPAPLAYGSLRGRRYHIHRGSNSNRHRGVSFQPALTSGGGSVSKGSFNLSAHVDRPRDVRLSASSITAANRGNSAAPKKDQHADTPRDCLPFTRPVAHTVSIGTAAAFSSGLRLRGWTRPASRRAHRDIACSLGVCASSGSAVARPAHLDSGRDSRPSDRDRVGRANPGTRR